MGSRSILRYVWAILSEFPGTSLKRLVSRAHLRLADRSDACEGPGWSRTEHMQQESGYVGGVPKMAAGAEAFLEDAGCWQASLQNARELLEAAGARERAHVGGSGRRVDCPRAWLAPGSPEEGMTPRSAKEGRRVRPLAAALSRRTADTVCVFFDSENWLHRNKTHSTNYHQAHTEGDKL